MSGNDDITDRLVEGSSYDEATLTVRRAVGLSLDGKIGLAAVALLASTLLAPALFFSRSQIASLESSGEVFESPHPVLTGLVCLGIGTAFVAGSLLVWLQHTITTRTLDIERARRLVRIEDFFVWFVLQGTLFVVVPTTLVVLATVVPGTADALYDWNVAIYRASETLGIDARLVSGIGGVLGTVLLILRRRTRRDE